MRAFAISPIFGSLTFTSGNIMRLRHALRQAQQGHRGTASARQAPQFQTETLPGSVVTDLAPAASPRYTPRPPHFPTPTRGAWLAAMTAQARAGVLAAVWRGERGHRARLARSLPARWRGRSRSGGSSCGFRSRRWAASRSTWPPTASRCCGCRRCWRSLFAALAWLSRARPVALGVWVGAAALCAGFLSMGLRTARVATPVLDHVRIVKLQGFVEEVDLRRGRRAAGARASRTPATCRPISRRAACA